jgi:ATP-dependent helicase/nuclease subunit B
MGQSIPPQIAQALTSGATLLTPNERSARTLRRAYASTQSTPTWTPPPILSLETWLHTLWTQLVVTGHETRLLLNPLQQQALWRQIIESDGEVSGLRSPDALAQLALDAFHQLHRYNGRSRLHDFAASTDARAFDRWAQAFDRLCLRERYLTPAQLPLALSLAPQLDLSSRSEAEGPAVAFSQATAESHQPELLLIDFDHIHPALTSFLPPHTRLTTEVPTQSAVLYQATDAANELHQAAHWAAAHLAENRSADLVLIVPNLADRRHQIDRVFHPILSEQGGQQNYEFSLGLPLAHAEPISTALTLLRWPLEPLPVETISALLLSPSLPTPSSAIAFDVQVLRQQTLLRPELSLEAFLQLLTRGPFADAMAPLASSLRALLRTAATENLLPPAPGIEGPRQSHAGWADTFRTLLEAVAWSTSTTQSSLAFQLRRAWDSALDSLCTLDFDATLVPATAALQSLTRITRDTIFAPESRSAPLQIMGPLELAGLPADALWFLSADDQTWPPTPPSNPLLPWQLRRELGLPGADPTLADSNAAALTHRLAHAAPEIVFSYPARDENGPRRPSPFLRDLHLTPFEDSQHPIHRSLATISSTTTSPAPLETIEDTEPLPTLAPGTLVLGGARVLELQSACSFRAFAEFRLHSTQPDSRSLGLDARDRGIQVHRIMQAFWDHLQTQQALKLLPADERQSLLNHCIEQALQRLTKSPGAPSQTVPSFEVGSHNPNPAPTQTPWESAYLEVQRKRLRALLNPWLDFETTRSPFTVLQQELAESATIGPLTLKLRADRIDQTPTGTFLLDYKTGPATPSDWLTDRPAAPQLPLYAVHAAVTHPDQPIAGLAFALLRAGDDLDLCGLTDDPTLIHKPGKMPWPALEDQISDWYRVLTNLAEAFAQNDPILNPRDSLKTCKHCTQRILCRLDPTTQPEEEEASNL